jgi:hypothetical protein
LIPAIAFLVEEFCPHRSEADLILRTQHRWWLPLSNLGLPFNAVNPSNPVSAPSPENVPPSSDPGSPTNPSNPAFLNFWWLLPPSYLESRVNPVNRSNLGDREIANLLHLLRSDQGRTKQTQTSTSKYQITTNQQLNDDQRSQENELILIFQFYYYSSTNS